LTPDFSLSADETDVTAAIRKNLVSLRLTDKTGMEADELDIAVVDSAGAIALPRCGVVLTLSLGWRGEPLTPKGRFVVDEVSEDGPPDTIHITARAADFRATLKAQRDASYHNATLGSILTKIARRHSLTPAIGADLARTAVAHIDQTGESDANFLTRLGKDYDAIATVKCGRLVFVRAGTGKTASGAILPAATIARSEGDRHSFCATDRDGTVTGVMARWHDQTSGKTCYALAGEEGVVKTLKRLYPTETAARAAADAAWAKIARAAHVFRVSLALGRPDILAGALLTLAGWRTEIVSRAWIAGDVTHTLDANRGLTTDIEAEEKV